MLEVHVGVVQQARQLDLRPRDHGLAVEERLARCGERVRGGAHAAAGRPHVALHADQIVRVVRDRAALPGDLDDDAVRVGGWIVVGHVGRPREVEPAVGGLRARVGHQPVRRVPARVGLADQLLAAAAEEPMLTRAIDDVRVGGVLRGVEAARHGGVRQCTDALHDLVRERRRLDAVSPERDVSEPDRGRERERRERSEDHDHGHDRLHDREPLLAVQPRAEPARQHSSGHLNLSERIRPIRRRQSGGPA